MCVQAGLTPLNVVIHRGDTGMAVPLIKAKIDIYREGRVRGRQIVVKLHAFDVLSVYLVCAEWIDTIEFRRFLRAYRNDFRIN